MVEMEFAILGQKTPTGSLRGGTHGSNAREWNRAAAGDACRASG
jgi:hypothetical protein